MIVEEAAATAAAEAARERGCAPPEEATTAPRHAILEPSVPSASKDSERPAPVDAAPSSSPTAADFQAFFVDGGCKFTKCLEQLNSEMLSAQEMLAHYTVELYELNARAIFLNPPMLSERIAELEREFADLRAKLPKAASSSEVLMQVAREE